MRRLLVSITLLTAACAPAAQRSSANRAAPSGEQPSVQLLDPGAEPRTRLRYRFAAAQRDGVKSGFVLTLQASDGQNAQLSIGLDKHVTVEALHADGSAQVRIAVEGGRFFGRDAHGEGSFDFSGIQGTARVDARGVVHDVTLTSRDTRAIPRELMLAIAANLTQPVPVEPVGLGAKWRLTRGTPWLVSLRGVGLTSVALDYEMDGAEGEPPRLPAAVTPYLPGSAQRPASWQGTGSVLLDLVQLGPTSMQLQQEMHFDFASPPPKEGRTVWDLVLIDRGEASATLLPPAK